MARKRATLADVAADTGVSLATVSKALNRRSGVSPTTRARVLASAERLGYPLTALIATDTVRAVAVVLENFPSPFSVGVLAAILEQAADPLLAAEVRVLDIAAASANETWRWMEGRTKETGVIILTSRTPARLLNEVIRAELTAVLIDPIDLDRNDVIRVSSGNWQGAYDATRLLLDLGHERIGFAGGLRGSEANAERAAGFRSALEAHGATVHPPWIRHGRFSSRTGLLYGEAVLSVSPRPTGILAASDGIAIGVLEAARQQGIAVPGELSIIGFDDSDAAAWTSPPLTTVRQPVSEIAATALALALADNRTPGSHRVQVPTRIVQRGSTGIAPSRL